MNFAKPARLLCALATALGFTTSVNAQDPALEQIVVIANRIPVPVKQIGTSVSVIDADAILEHGNVSLKDILRQSAAVGGSNYGGTGAISAIRIRGEEGFRTLTLFDGLRLSDPSGPQVATPVEHILSGGVGRVEILRGPQGLSYGADAGGVVSISSLSKTDGFAINLDGQTGSFGTNQIAATVSAANDNADFFLAASDFQGDGYNVRLSDTVLSDKDGYENQTLHTRIGYNLNSALRVELVHREVDGETQYDGCWAGTTVYDCEALYALDATRLSTSYTGERFSHTLAYARSETDRDDLALGTSAFSSNGQLERWEYVGSVKKLPGFDLVFGVDLEQEENDLAERDNEGYYLEVLSNFSDSLYLTAGVRRDHNDDYGNHQSYRVSAAYLITLPGGVLKLRSSFGSGFRAPSLYEVAYNSGPFAYPPASLVRLGEETSKGLEAGIEYAGDNGLQLEFVVFEQRVEDAIYFDLSAYSGYLQDLGRSDSTGFELVGSYPLLPGLSLQGNYTYNETERPNGQPRLRRPEHLANVGLSYRSGNERLYLHGFWRATRDAIDEVFGSAVALEDTAVLDLGGNYRFSDSIELYARLENALDDRFQEVVDYRAPGRASYLGIRVNF